MSEEKWTLHVEGLTRNVHDGHLAEIFGTYGLVSSARVEVDRRSGLSKGFGYVEVHQGCVRTKLLARDIARRV